VLYHSARDVDACALIHRLGGCGAGDWDEVSCRGRSWAASGGVDGEAEGCGGCWRVRSMMDWSKATMPCIRSATPVSYKHRVQETPMYIVVGFRGPL
jgi:hypothetical protein